MDFNCKIKNITFKELYQGMWRFCLRVTVKNCSDFINIHIKILPYLGVCFILHYNYYLL